MPCLNLEDNDISSKVFKYYFCQPQFQCKHITSDTLKNISMPSRNLNVVYYVKHFEIIIHDIPLFKRMYIMLNKLKTLFMTCIYVKKYILHETLVFKCYSWYATIKKNYVMNLKKILFLLCLNLKVNS